jgi:hypothetical protein
MTLKMAPKKKKPEKGILLGVLRPQSTEGNQTK